MLEKSVIKELYNVVVARKYDGAKPYFAKINVIASLRSQ